MHDDRNKPVRPLSEARPHKPFGLSADHRPTVKDKDNAQPVIPPPRTVFIPHPQLAPPGMMGSRLAREASRWMEAKKVDAPDRGEKREFKSLAPTRGKDRGFDR